MDEQITPIHQQLLNEILQKPSNAIINNRFSENQARCKPGCSGSCHSAIENEQH